MSITIRYAKDKEDSEWLLNQSFMKVFSNISQFDPNKAFKPWFRTILINTVLTANKKFYLEQKKEDEDDYPNEDEADVFSKIGYEQIIKEIQQLSPAYRTVLNLYLIDGYKHHEIADQLGISVGSSKSNLFKAKEILKKRLKNNLGIER